MQSIKEDIDSIIQTAHEKAQYIIPDIIDYERIVKDLRESGKGEEIIHEYLTERERVRLIYTGIEDNLMLAVWEANEKLAELLETIPAAERRTAENYINQKLDFFEIQKEANSLLPPYRNYMEVVKETMRIKNPVPEKSEADFVQGFNEGYILAEYLPDVADLLYKVTSSSERMAGFKAGRAEYMIEKMKEKIQEWDKEKPIDKDRGLDKAIDDLEKEWE